MAETAYYLTPHTYLRRVHHHWVVLDAQRDRYFCIPSSDFDRVVPWLAGMRPERVANDQELPSETATLVRELLNLGLISQSREHGKPFTPVDLPPVRRVLEIQSTSGWMALGRIPAFLVACATADYFLRNKPLIETIRRVLDRRTRHSQAAFDSCKAVRLVSDFNTWRLLYPRSYVCLFDCLALCELMARHGLYPYWVFAVTTDPFEAHCWLQYGDMLLGDTMDRVARFHPIMRV